MKHFAWISALALTLGIAAAADTVTAKLQPFKGWDWQNMLHNRGVEIFNQENLYRFALLTSKPDANGLTNTFMVLTEPSNHCGFGYGPSNFLYFIVNDRLLNYVQPREENFLLWKDGGREGAEFPLNFNGTKLNVRVFMRPGSPLFLVRVSQPEEQIAPLKSAVIRLQFSISELKYEGNKVIWNGGYDHRAKTAVRELEMSDGEIPLTPEDKYLILYDKIYDGSATGLGRGPSYLAFDFNSGVEKAMLDLKNTGANTLKIHLKPDFKEIVFGVWDRKKPISNAAFFEMFEKEKAAFQLP